MNIRKIMKMKINFKQLDNLSKIIINLNLLFVAIIMVYMMLPGTKSIRIIVIMGTVQIFYLIMSFLYIIIKHCNNYEEKKNEQFYGNSSFVCTLQKWEFYNLNSTEKEEMET